jgi:dTDP-4-dehydrorhamnose reductase
MGSAHSHPAIISYAIPSYGDLKWLLDCYDSATPTRKEFAFAIIVCKDNNGVIHVYSLKINNIIEFRTKIMEIFNDTKYDGLDDEDKIKKIQSEQGINLKNSNGQLEKCFLEQFKNFGFDLLEATNDNLDEWKKVELTPTATVIKVPC